MTYTLQGDTVVNGASAGDQYNSSAARLGDGSYVVVWQTGDAAPNAVLGQLHAADGTVLGGEFQINAGTGGTYVEPRVAALSGGGFAVVWSDSSELSYRLFEADGTPLGGDLTLTTADEFGGYDWQIDVAPTADGGFVVTFLRPTYGDLSSVEGEQVHALFVGGVLDGQLVEISSTYAAPRATQIALLPNGDYVICWTDQAGSSEWDAGTDTETGAPMFQILTAGGILSGAPQTASTGTMEGSFGGQGEFSYGAGEIAMLSDGGFVMTWIQEDASGTRDLYQRRYGSTGAAAGGPVLIAGDIGAQGGPLATGLQGGPIAVGLSDGGWLVAWYAGDAANSEVLAQRYATDGSADGAPFQINGYDPHTQYPAALLANPGGGFTMFFESEGQDGSGYGIYQVIGNVRPSDVAVAGGAPLSVNEYAIDGASVGAVTGSDADDSVLTYSLADDAGGRFSIDADSGAIKVADGLLLDFEQASSHEVVVRVTDAAGGIYEETVPIGVGNLDPENVTGDTRANKFVGGAGSDRLDGGDGDDHLIGRRGNDTYVVEGNGDRVSEQAGGGSDTVESSGDFFLRSNIEQLTLTGSGDTSGFGNDLANALTGNDGSNRLDGRGGADRLEGAGGNDRYFVDHAGDEIVEASEGGFDAVFSSVSHQLADEVESLRLTGASAIDGSGNASANRLFGNAAANRIDGGDKSDALFGGAGNDLLTGGAGADRFYFDTALDTADNVDAISDFAARDRIFLARSIFTEVAAGAFDPGAFRAGAVAADDGDRILYDASTGNIFYDADGSGSGAAMLFAKVAAGTELEASDFIGY